MKVIEDFNLFDEYAKKIIDKYKIPGVAIGINRFGRQIYEKEFGYRNREIKAPVSADTIFGIASITKSFTCIAIMQLQETRKLSVHDKVVTYLPEFRIKNSNKGDSMTIHHFMSNSSGLPPLASAENQKKPVETPLDFMEYMAQLDIELLGEPGMEFSYSNHAFGLLGIIIERITGQSYSEYIKENIFDPAGMLDSTTYLSDLESHKKITKLYETKQVKGTRSTYPVTEWSDQKTPTPAIGALKSTVNDMLKYTEIFNNVGVVGSNRILRPESIKEMTHPHIEIFPNKYYGYGLIITPDYFGSKMIEHSGSLEGVSSSLSVVPEKGISSIILMNLQFAPSESLTKSALNIALGKSINNSHNVFPTQKLIESEFKKYLGVYVSDEGAKIKVDLYGGKLTFLSDGYYYPIRSLGNHLFAIKEPEQEGLVRFIMNNDREAARLKIGLRQLKKVEKSN